jgi:hypothetical protein
MFALNKPRPRGAENLLATMISKQQFAAHPSHRVALWARRCTTGEPVSAASSIALVFALGLALYVVIELVYPEIMK